MAAPPVTQALVYTSIAVIVTIISRKLIRLYTNWWKLPPGPFPLPLIGSIHVFRQNRFPHEVAVQLSEKYGPVITIFAGHIPAIIVTDPEIGLQVLKKHTFAGRPNLPLDGIFVEKGATDIIMGDFSKEWEALRKVGHSAARKYAVSPKLASSVTGVVDRVIEEVGEQPKDSEELFSLTMTAILAEAAFGKKYDFQDPDFIKWREAGDVLIKENKTLMTVALLPFMRFILMRGWRRITEQMGYARDYVKKMHEKALEEYTDGKNDSFIDALITAKKEAEEEENWMSPHLHPKNIRAAVGDLFGAGTDTTKMTLLWIFLMMCKQCTGMQDKMRKEVLEAIGSSDESPQLEHRTKCHFVCAFIAETMRLKYIVPFGVAHKTTTDVELNGYSIPGGTMVAVLLLNALNDKKTWGDPETFRPERFIDLDGKFISKPNPYFIPFSDGRRSCPGNKLALNDMFLVVARFLQRTKSIEVVGGVTDEMMRGDLSQTNGFRPSAYSLRLSLA